MKIKTLLAASLLVPGLALAAVQNNTTNQKFYGKVEAGVVYAQKVKVNGQIAGTTFSGTSNKFKASPVLGLGIGYGVSDFFRTDLMVNYRSLAQKKGAGRAAVRMWNVMLNGYLDGHNSTALTPYITAGLGVGRNHAGSLPFIYVDPQGETKAITAQNKAQRGFVWNVGAGVRTKVADKVHLDFAYRYTHLGRLKWTGSYIDVDDVTDEKVQYNVIAKVKRVRANEFVIGATFSL